jgi:hypothetical protein
LSPKSTTATAPLPLRNGKLNRQLSIGDRRSGTEEGVWEIHAAEQSHCRSGDKTGKVGALFRGTASSRPPKKLIRSNNAGSHLSKPAEHTTPWHPASTEPNIYHHPLIFHIYITDSRSLPPSAVPSSLSLRVDRPRSRSVIPSFGCRNQDCTPLRDLGSTAS